MRNARLIESKIRKVPMATVNRNNRAHRRTIGAALLGG